MQAKHHLSRTVYCPTQATPVVAVAETVPPYPDSVPTGCCTPARGGGALLGNTGGGLPGITGVLLPPCEPMPGRPAEREMGHVSWLVFVG